MYKEFTPDIKVVSSYESPFTLNLLFSISRLPPNQLLKFWVFSPHNGSMDDNQLSSNDKGNSIDMYGKNEISYRFSTSDILPNSLYKLCVNMVFFKYDRKFNFKDWLFF
jgi:hypothetical protein